jgi:hypothetical protein
LISCIVYLFSAGKEWDELINHLLTANVLISRGLDILDCDIDIDIDRDRDIDRGKIFI